MTSRIEELEDLLQCQIIEKFSRGESLEKYLAKLGNQQVILRIYRGQYYDNRYLREGLALRALSEKKRGFLFPEIVEEWPEFGIRAVSWFDADEPATLDQAQSILKEIGDLTELKSPFSLEQDITTHLLNVSSMNLAYQEPFLEQLDLILTDFNWNDHPHNLIHGDFHLENLAQDQGTPVVYDWEYASVGSPSYDIAYLMITSRQESTLDPSYDKWVALVTAVITHWYLQEADFSPKMAIDWFDRLNARTMDL